ncbi:UDP-glucuronosyl/UDP-glucosyltransferase [Artemisia annua]|uniref:UDP-glucuronosyl/UDP-glucosyltransferase n=1 Tax=Artemisia annua TaxID=35608 RepID=A0A2U1LVC6_ARTAN|nr:UDP-glucuronosyl/UDP-glucosyltransferase [Artemisia annua]
MENQKKNTENTHVLIIPYIAQGHVIPLLELAQCLIKHGVKVTFVNTDVNHNIIMKTWLEKDSFGPLMNMVSIPDGMEASEDRNNFIIAMEAINQVMPGKLEELIKMINKTDGDKISCVIADVGMPWATRVAEKLRIRRATFWSAPAATLATLLSIQKLIDDGIMDNEGVPLENIFHLSPNMPPMSTAEFGWACMGTLETTKILFKYAVEAVEAEKTAEWKLCNSTHELEAPTFNMFPNLLPIGPLLASNRLSKQAGHFWQQDSTCLAWLDQQPMSSVIYVAFGSFTIFNQTQFQELALGLELTNRPFLWVVRTGLTKETSDTYPDGYMDRIGTRGKIVGWAPQQEVLAHPSIACFLSHCGWNSTLEGVSNAVPFLSWPYFADQLLNKTYICDIWMNGLGFRKDENGIIRSEEIKDKVDKLLNNKEFKTRALNLKEKVMSSIREGGCSHENFKHFIEWIKETDYNGKNHTTQK